MGNNGQLPYIDGLRSAIELKVTDGDFFQTGELAPCDGFGPFLINGSFNHIID